LTIQLFNANFYSLQHYFLSHFRELEEKSKKTFLKVS